MWLVDGQKATKGLPVVPQWWTSAGDHQAKATKPGGPPTLYQTYHAYINPAPGAPTFTGAAGMAAVTALVASELVMITILNAAGVVPGQGRFFCTNHYCTHCSHHEALPAI